MININKIIGTSVMLLLPFYSFAQAEEKAREVLDNTAQISHGIDAALILGIIGTVLAIAAIILVLLMVVYTNKRIEKIENSLGDLKILKSQRMRLKEMIIELENTISEGKTTIDDLRRKTISYVPDNNQIYSNISNIGSGSNPESVHREYSNINNQEIKRQPNLSERINESPRGGDSIKKREISKPTEFYVSTPNGDIFEIISSEYKPGESLYKIYTRDGQSGIIEFLDRKEALIIARSNINRKLKPVCSINGQLPDSCDKIVNIEPGKVVKTPSGWRLEKKAIIELV